MKSIEQKPVSTYWLAAEKTGWVDRLTTRVSEWLNPIVVKEARQSLKSNQFLITFLSILVFGLGYSLLAVLNGRGTYPSGDNMLIGYLWILAFPLVLVVPFFTFRSMVSEREDNTYELLAITALKPRQIVWGKLASGLLQVLIYVSAISPCIVFTYLLRGVEIWVVLLTIWTLVFASVVFCILGLFLATISQYRAFQIMLSVLLILGLGFCYVFGCSGMTELILDHEFQRIEQEMLPALVGIYLIPGTYAALLFVAASARLKFVSDNRSTTIRIVLLMQQTLFVAWLIWTASLANDLVVLLIGFMFAAMHWLAIGSMILGERKELSERVRRRLPRDNFSQAFFSLLTPGPGTGYLFVMGNVVSFAVFVVATIWFCHAFELIEIRIFRRSGVGLSSVVWFCLIWCLYIVGYLAVARLIVEAVRSRIAVGLTQVFSFFLTAVLVVAGTVLPLLLQATFFYKDLRMDYSVLQASNPFWTSGEIMTLYRGADSAELATSLVTLITVPLMLFSLFTIARERVYVPAETPQRILQETQPLTTDAPVDPLA